VTGKNVCVIGNGPTSINIMEAFAPQAKHLVQICRTPREIHVKLSFEDTCAFLDRHNIDKNNSEEVHKFMDVYFHERVFTGYGESSRAKKLEYGHLLSNNEEDIYHKSNPLTEEDKAFIKLMTEKGLVPKWNSGYTHLRQLFVRSYH